MSNRGISTVLLIGWLCLAANPAEAMNESFCAPFDTAVQKLAEAGEDVIAFYRDGDFVKGLFGDRSSGAWTLVAMDSRGYVCTMRSGAGLTAPEGRASRAAGSSSASVRCARS